MEFIAESLPTLIGAASAAVPLIQSQQLHKKEMETALELHRQAIEQANRIHQTEVALSLKQHKEALQKALDQHLEDIQLTIEAARRENLRDVWAQKSRRAETLLVMTSLMISGFFTLIVEGIFSFDAWPVIVGLYSVFLAVAFSCLFLALFLTMRYQSRMNDYNIYDAKQVYTCGRTHEAFESYYDCHCGSFAKISTLLFYGGTLLLLCSAALLQFNRWYLQYSNRFAGIVYLVIGALTLIGLVLVNIVMKTKTRAPNTATEVEAAEEDYRRTAEGQLGRNPPVRRVLTSVFGNSGALPTVSDGTEVGLGGASSFAKGSSKLRRRRKTRKLEEESNAFQAYLERVRSTSARDGEVLRKETHEAERELEKSWDLMRPVGEQEDEGIPVARTPSLPTDPGNMESTLSKSTRMLLKDTRRRSQGTIERGMQHPSPVRKKDHRITEDQIAIDLDLFGEPPKTEPSEHPHAKNNNNNNNDGDVSNNKKNRHAHFEEP